MDKKELQRYPHVCRELKALRAEQAELAVKLRETEARKKAMEDFVGALPDESQREIAGLRALQGLPWAQVAARMGYKFSEGSVRKRYEKIFKDNV